jgi:hypothetical protein
VNGSSLKISTESSRTPSSLLTNLVLFDDLLLCSAPLNFLISIGRRARSGTNIEPYEDRLYFVGFLFPVRFKTLCILVCVYLCNLLTGRYLWFYVCVKGAVSQDFKGALIN